MFRPELFSCHHTRDSIIKDLSAGLVLGIVALPLAIAFAIASGVKPEQGLYTAIIAGFIVALLGGSRVQVTGPTGAFIVVVYGVVQTHGYSGLALATIMAGLMILIMGLARMGKLLKFIPYPLIVGFTSGIAVIIFSSQINDLLGLELEAVPAPFIDKWEVYVQHFHKINWTATTIGLISLIGMFILPKYKIPTSLIIIVFSTIFVSLLNLPIQTIESRFGAVPNTLPSLTIPEFNLTLLRTLFPSSLTIALLSAIESLLSATVADGMTRTRHNPDTELIALGIGNMITPLFGGIPATGAIARTATNVKSGAQTPLSSIVHAGVLLLILLLFGDYAGKIPLCTLAGILIYIAYNMAEIHTFYKMFKAPSGDLIIMLSTFTLTVLLDLTIAIEVGIIFSALLFLKRMESSTEVALITQEITKGLEDDLGAEISNIPKGVDVFALEGPLFFGAIERFETAMHRISEGNKILILRMRNVPIIDAAGIHALITFKDRLESSGKKLLLSGLRPQPRQALKRSGFLDSLGEENVTQTTKDALSLARDLNV